MAFDPQSFMEMSTDDEMDTSIPAITPADYAALIKKVTPHPLKDKDTGQTRTDTIRLQVDYLIVDDELKALREMPEGVPVSDSIFIEFTPEGGFATATGKNVRLGALREALGLNGAGFNLGLLNGAGPLLIRIKNTPNEDDPEAEPYNNVQRVAAI